MVTKIIKAKSTVKAKQGRVVRFAVKKNTNRKKTKKPKEYKVSLPGIVTSVRMIKGIYTNLTRTSTPIKVKSDPTQDEDPNREEDIIGELMIDPIGRGNDSIPDTGLVPPDLFQMYSVQSSNVSRVGFALGRMRVEFLNGSAYQYFEIDSDVYRWVKLGVWVAKDGHTPSVGAALHNFVKRVGKRYIKE